MRRTRAGAGNAGLEEGLPAISPPHDEAEAQQLQVQAAQLAAHLRNREKELDHREAQLNARTAQLRGRGAGRPTVVG